MTDFQIELDWINSVAALGFPELAGVPIEYPNKVLDSYPDLWLKVINVRGNTVPVTLGLNGDDNHNGFCQIDISVKSGIGSGLVLKLASKIKNFYRAGLGVGLVVVASSSVSPGREVGGWYRVSVTVYYYSRIARSA